MKYYIEHHLPGRARLRLTEELSNKQGAILVALLDSFDGLRSASFNNRTGGLLLKYDVGTLPTLCGALQLLTIGELIELEDQFPEQGEEYKSLFTSVAELFAGWFFRSLLPMPLRAVITTWRSLPFLAKGWESIAAGQFGVDLLDASAVAVSLLRGDVATAGSIMTLLQLGETIEDWTRRRSRESLADSLALNVDTVWRRNSDGTNEQIPFAHVRIGDELVVYAGNMVPVDGTVVSGEGMVNQSSLTGEGLPVYKGPEITVYAGTALEEGELIVRVTALPQDSRLQEIGKLIDESEALKAETQFRAERLADKVVPLSFLLALVTYLVTGSAARAANALVVDYSCAIKLTTPLSILSAMREGVKQGVVIKGGKYLEALHDADTLVFDKTGTLTVASPTVCKVVPFGDWSRDEVLRLSACLEEHFPHSIATAIVKQAEQEGLIHQGEDHTKVDYVIAHGLSSTHQGKEVLLGSEHFVLQDKGVQLSDEQRETVEHLSDEGSILYLAADGKLAGILVIQDPLRTDAHAVIKNMKSLGLQEVVMLTGDHPRVAGRVARELAVDGYRAEMLPAEKTDVIKALKRSGRKVIMVGDGVNDSPSLATSDVGVSFRTASDVAQEVADVILTDDLSSLITARQLSSKVMGRIRNNYRTIVAGNTALLLAGITGLISPALGALLHNGLTIGLSLHSLKPLLGGEESVHDSELHPGASKTEESSVF